MGQRGRITDHMQTYDLDVGVSRGASLESRHRVHAAVVGEDGRLVGSARDASYVSYWRSCAKPFQVMPFIESGGFDELGWGEDELALACASHGGEPEHVALAESMLHDIGLEEGDLACGPHEPLSSRGARIVRELGGRPTRLHNNCSGKHAAMLAYAHTAGWSTNGYEREDHAVQRSALDVVSRWTEVPEDRILRAVDGCGVVVFGMPLECMAHAYARFAGSTRRGEEVPSRIAASWRTRPFLIGGTERFDSILAEETSGNVVAKIGAEGVHSVAVIDAGLGIALKVEDGTPRAQFPAMIRILQRLGSLPDPLPPRLAEMLRKPVRNTRGEVVGEIHPLA
jgi:L-asparaginase II